MPDLTMCADAECPSRKSCSRYMMIPWPQQSYADFQRKSDDDRCSEYIDMWKDYEEGKEDG